MRLSKNTPPTFIAVANDDEGCAEESIRYHLGLRSVGVKSELHVYSGGGHGFGLRAHAGDAATWPERCAEWMRSQGLLPAVQTPAGFTALFNGRDLAGWAGSPKYWSVEEGALTGVADGKLDYNRFIVWRGGTVKNFEWRARVKVTPGGNSGLQYRSVERPDLGEAVVTGYQCDVVSNRADYDGMLYEERGRRILAHSGERVVIDPQGQPWVVGKFRLKAFAAGEWHDYRILVQGNRHQHWIDGHPTVDLIDLDEKGRRLEGVLGMQVHVGPPMKIQFRDLFLKRLPDDLPLITADGAKIPTDAVKVAPQGQDPPRKPD